MKRFFLFVISALCIFQSLALSAGATSGQGIDLSDPATAYAGIIALLCATIGIVIYVIATYFKK